MTRKRILGLVVAIACLAATLTATSIVPMSVEKLTASSSDVVEARAIDAHSAWDADRTMIYTYTRFTVRRTLKGTSPNVIIVKQMGGHADGYTQKVSGVRHWQPGDEAVLFLQPSNANDGTLIVTGLVQGNFHMLRQPSGAVMVSNGVPDVSAVQQRTNMPLEYRGTKMSIQDLEQRVRKAQEQ
jgi:Ni/Co efflux regulator RcnB